MKSKLILFACVVLFCTVYHAQRPTQSSIRDNFVYVSQGSFNMGCTKGSANKSELPVHEVTLSYFYISKYEVTQKEYAAIMDNEVPSWSKRYGLGDNYPAYGVSWYSAITYCNLRSINEGLTPAYSISGSTDPKTWGQIPQEDNPIWNSVQCNWDANGYRLPTEAEWEYAARGAAITPDYQYSGSDNVDTVAWHEGNNGPFDKSNYGSKTVGSKSANSLGLFDMSGNVWELCWDWSDLTYYRNSPRYVPKGPEEGRRRVKRGGSWVYGAEACRVSYRGSVGPQDNHVLSATGFRLCRSRM